jgi:predicted lipoprotein with Yx(FWY)xxD motif
MDRLVTIAAIVASLALAACGGDDDDAPVAQAPATETTNAAETGAANAHEGKERAKEERPAAEEKPGTTITTGDSQYGEILFDDSDQVVYLFDKESSETSECYGDCAAAWPPVLTQGDPRAAGGADAKLLGTTKRDDGSTQVTYDGHPLYYYVDDPVGEVLCHNVVEFGGLWLVLEPGGDAVS